MNQSGLLKAVQQENCRVILDLLEPGKNARILDCGCGEGDFTAEVARRIGAGQVCGIEFIEEVAQKAEKNGIQVFRVNLNEKIPVEDAAFDFVLASQIIHYLYETDLFIREIHRVLKPGGYAIIATPNLASLHNIVSLVFGRQPHTAHISNEVRVGTLFKPSYPKRRDRGIPHLRIFTYEGLKRLFEYHQFRVERMLGVGYYPFPIGIAKLLSRLDARHAVNLTIKVRKVV